MMDLKTILELEDACESARAYMQAFTEAVKAQADKHDIPPAALRRYVVARVTDKLAKLEAEQDAYHQLSLLDTPEASAYAAPTSEQLDSVFRFEQQKLLDISGRV